MATKKLIASLKKKKFKRHPKYMNRAERIRLGVHKVEQSWRVLWATVTPNERKDIDEFYRFL